MKTIKTRTIHKTDDGKEFTDAKAAQRHEALTQAQHRYESARRDFGKLLAETFFTADGHPFTFEHWSYWFLHLPCGQLPRLIQVNFGCRNWDVDFDEWKEGDMLKIISTHPFGEKNGNFRYPINELFRDRSAAEAACKQARREWLTQQIAELDGKAL